jgi:hypothetical protein
MYPVEPSLVIKIEQIDTIETQLRKLQHCLEVLLLLVISVAEGVNGHDKQLNIKRA